MIASQKPGIETPRNAQVVNTTSSQVFRLQRGEIPAGTEIARR